MPKFQGHILKIRYRNPENGWSLALFRDQDGNEHTVAGLLPLADEEEMVEIIAEPEQHPKYGPQLKVEVAYKLMPTTLIGLESYLRNEVEGVGPVLARRLIDHFGGQLMEILEAGDWKQLATCPGVKSKLSQRVIKSWEAGKDTSLRQTSIFLAQHGISPSWAAKILDTFGAARAIEILSSNPYRLTQVEGIGFLKADAMARALGFAPDSPQRAEAAFKHVIHESMNRGHVFLFQDEAIESVLRLIGGGRKPEMVAMVNEALEVVVSVRDVVREKVRVGPDISRPILYLPRAHKHETGTAKRVQELLTYPHQSPPGLDAAARIVQQSIGIQLSPKQLEAVRSVFTNHLCIINGSPGTGKTTVTRSIAALAKALNKTCLLVAPTGRAAKRLAEVTGSETGTIHRALEYDPTDNEFGRRPSNPLEADIVVVDESSMVDLELAYHLLRAVPSHCSVVLVGDVDQLPSVGAGMVLSDMIRSRRVHATTLDTIFRQAEDSLIIRNAHRIRQGLPPTFPPEGSVANSYLMPVPKIEAPDGKQTEDIEYLKQKLARLISVNIPEKLKLDPIRDVQVLAPMKKGTAGVEELNKTLQQALNPQGRPFQVGSQHFRVGDRVMQFRNNYKLHPEISLYNGDIGFITDYDAEARILKVDFYGKVLDYPYEDASDLHLAYCQTVHKVQGAEYPVVIIVLLAQHSHMLERNLLYTANTRATKMALYLSSKWALEAAASKCEVQQRNTLLAQRIRALEERDLGQAVR